MPLSGVAEAAKLTDAYTCSPRTQESIMWNLECQAEYPSNQRKVDREPFALDTLLGMRDFCSLLIAKHTLRFNSLTKIDQFHKVEGASAVEGAY